MALGAIQGPTELLPVSSSGHLVLVPALLGWRYRELDPELRKSFEVALHAGGALALLIGLRREVAEYLRSLRRRQPRRRWRCRSRPRPLAALAVRAPDRAAARRARAGRGRADRRVRGDGARGRLPRGARAATRRRPADALAIGFAQAFALVPGVSRNGATLTAARVLRFRRADANVISRQIALPVILGAAALKGVRLARRGVPPGVARGMVAGAGGGVRLDARVDAADRDARAQPLAAALCGATAPRWARSRCGGGAGAG